MATSTPLRSVPPALTRIPKASSNSFPVSFLGRQGERHVTGTITRRDVNSTTLLTESPYRYLIAFSLLLAPSFYDALTSGNSPQSLAAAAIGLLLLITIAFGVDHLRARQRITMIEEFTDGSHVARGMLAGSGPLQAGRKSHVGLYVTNHGVLLVTEQRGNRTEHRVDRLDLTATPAGRVIGAGFMIDGAQYALQAPRGSIVAQAGQ